MTYSEIKDAANAILEECEEDYVGLWGVPWYLREVKRISAIDVRFNKSIAVVEEILLAKDVVVGQFNNNEFEIWDSTPLKVIERIQNEWKALSREPTIGEICWFTKLQMLSN